MVNNATSIAFVVDQLSPDTVSLSLQDEAHPRLLQQSPVRSILQNIASTTCSRIHYTNDYLTWPRLDHLVSGLIHLILQSIRLRVH